MPEKLGEAVLELRTDKQGYDSGLDEAKKKTEGLTGSILKAEIAHDLLRKAVEVLKEVVIGSTEKFIEHEKAIKQLDTVLNSTGHAAGLTSGEVVNIAESLSSLTGVETDTIIGAQNLLLTFTNIKKDVFPQVTETVLDMSVALKEDLKSACIQVGKALQDPVNGITALRRVGVNFNDEQKSVIENLVKTGQQAKAQALILKELQTEFGGSARAARDTFGGALKALQSNFTELQITGGSYIAKIGRPFVEQTVQMTKGINDFLNSKAGMQEVTAVASQLAGVLSVMWKVGGQLFETLSKYAGNIFDSIKTGFSAVAGKGNEANVTFDILGGALKIIGTGFSISAKFVDLFIQEIVLLVNSIKDTIGIFQTFGTAITDPLNASKWQKVADQGKQVFQNFADFGKKAFSDVGGVITDMQNAFKTFTTDSKNNGKEIQKTYNDAVSAMAASMSKGDAVVKNSMEQQQIQIRKTQEAVDNYRKYYGNAMQLIAAETKIATDDAKKDWQDSCNTIKTYVDMTGQALGPVFESIGAALVTQGDAWKNVGKAGVLAIAAIVKSLGDQLGAMAAAKLAEAIADSLDPFSSWAAPGQYAAAAELGAGAAAAYIASGAISAWANSLAKGGDFVTNGPQLLMVGDNPSGREHVRVEPLDSSGGGYGGGMTVQIGTVNSDVDLEKGMQRAYLRFQSMSRRSK